MNMNITKKTIALLSIATLSILAVPVYAHQNSTNVNSYDRIEQRLDNQRNRIRKGIGSGELTHTEARRLQKQQRFIMRLTYRLMHDGYLDRYELRELRDTLERASTRIYHLKHNNRNRYTKHKDHNRHTKQNTNHYYY